MKCKRKVGPGLVSGGQGRRTGAGRTLTPGSHYDVCQGRTDSLRAARGARCTAHYAPAPALWVMSRVSSSRESRATTRLRIFGCLIASVRRTSLTTYCVWSYER